MIESVHRKQRAFLLFCEQAKNWRNFERVFLRYVTPTDIRKRIFSRNQQPILSNYKDCFTELIDLAKIEGLIFVVPFIAGKKRFE